MNTKTITEWEEVTKSSTTPFNYFELTYNDGYIQNVEIRLELTEAKKYYVGHSFGYWCGASNTEKQHTVISIKEID